MKGQQKATEVAAASQVADQVWGRQVEALSGYLQALLELSAASPIKPHEDYKRTGSIDGGTGAAMLAIDEREQLNGRIARRVSTTGAVWRLLHHTAGPTVGVIGDLENEIVASFWAVTVGTTVEDVYREEISQFIKWIQEWQARPETRNLLSDKMAMEIGALIEDRGGR